MLNASRIVPVDSTVTRVCVTLDAGLGCVVVPCLDTTPCPVEGTEIVMRLRRAGDSALTELVEYPLFTQSGATLCFHFDSLFYDLNPGRYIGTVYVDDVARGEIQFQLGSQYTLGVPTFDRADCGG